MGAVMFSSPMAFAQEDGEARSKFYDFDDMLIDGQFKKPDIMKEKAREKASFSPEQAQEGLPQQGDRDVRGAGAPVSAIGARLV